MSTVPFGKYKGRPVEQMLADADYMAWLEAQPWFRERFAHLTRRDAESLSRTPEHNRLQALFLEEDYCLAFARAVDSQFFVDCVQMHSEQVGKDIKLCHESAPVWFEKADAAERDAESIKARFPHRDPIEDAKSWRAAADTWGKVGRQVNAHSLCRFTASSTFEDKGADVRVVVQASWPSVTGRIKPEIRRNIRELQYLIEVKPVVADDYPAVLRQMNRNKSTHLFLASYEAEGATYAQFLKIFMSSGIRVVLQSTVDREVEGHST